MSNKNDHDIYIIPPNFIESGTFFGGMFRARNVIEAGILAFAIGVPVFMFVPFGLTTRIIILCLTALPAALVALIGISGESLSEFLIIFLKYLRNRRIVGGDGQQPNEQAPPMKRPGRHLKQRAPKEKESRPPKRRRSGESDFPAEFDEVRSYEIREKLRPKKKPKKELSSKKAKKKPNKRKEKARPPKRPAHIKEQPPACLNPVADYLPIEKIQNGIIYTKDHRYVKVVEVVPINFIVNQQTVSEQKLLDSGSATAEMLHFLMACIRYGVSVCIAGSTGSGKTTIMAWLLSNVPNNQRLITIEEGSREFDLVKRDENGNILNSVIHLLTRPSENPALNINQDFLLERVLRKHPNVIGVGEMRSAAESLSAAESSRTGHTVCTTIHSNSCNSTYRRMMTLAKRKYSMDDSVLMEIMVEAYPIVVFTKQLEDRSRKIMEILEGEDFRDGQLVSHTLYKFEVEDNVTDRDGNVRVVGHHRKVGLISDTLKKRLLDNGISNKELAEFMQPPKEVD